jgi:hypothetical protein
LNAQAMTRHDLKAEIVQRSWEDNEFRKEFVAHPDGAFGKYFQISADRLPQIVVHEEPAGTWRIVLPAIPAHAGELSDENLERIAGGTISAAAFPTAVGIAVITSAYATVSVSVGAGGW